MTPRNQKPWKGAGMEGWIARWYTRTRKNDMEDFRRQAKNVAGRLRHGCDVLEVAPGPGFFAIELAKLGNFKITCLDASRTFVDIATKNAQAAGAKIDFRLGNASAMPLGDESFDFIYCSAAFKNFSEPVKAIDEMHRVLRPGGEAVIGDLRKDASLDEIDAYVDQSGRSRFDARLTKRTLRWLTRRAYTGEEFQRMAHESLFGVCEINPGPIGYEVRFSRAVHSIVPQA